MRKPVLAIALATLLAAPALGADTWTTDKTHSDVSFTIRHFVAKTRGRFTDFTGTIVADPTKPEASTVEFTIQTASIDTGDPGRDKHLRSADFFEVEKYPTITFRSTKVTPKGKDQFDVTGELTMKGVTKTITLPVTFNGTTKDPRGGERGGFDTSTRIPRKDYGISWNKALDAGGFVLGDDVDVTISLETIKKKDAPPAS